MVRRKAGVPEYARGEIVPRAASGTGHDGAVATETMPGVFVPASQALVIGSSSPQMLRRASEVMAWLVGQGATHVDCVRDSRPEIRPGGLTVLWADGPQARACAQHFASGFDAAGLPLLPSWLSLRADDDFDLRWQHKL